MPSATTCKLWGALEAGSADGEVIGDAIEDFLRCSMEELSHRALKNARVGAGRPNGAAHEGCPGAIENLGYSILATRYWCSLLSLSPAQPLSH